MRTEQFDFLVIGGGVAGLTFALNVADYGSVAVLFKGALYDSATRYAQGGIAAVQDADDSLELHVEDTLVAGAGLCQRRVVEFVVSEGQQHIEELVGWGTMFDRAKNGDGYDLHREGGHSRRRILHSADSTGFEIQRALLSAADAHPNISFFERTMCIDLILGRGNRALGAYVLDERGEPGAFLAKRTLVAAGGAGQVFRHTTNPEVATGDGIALCYRAGCSVSNLEFFQFHPTSIFHPYGKSFLLTEALRGEGAILRNQKGEAFMSRYHPLADLAPRDIVARAIDSEIKVSGAESVFLDISHREAGFVEQHFPTVFRRCRELGFRLDREPVPIVPAAHYCCGGVVCDEHGRTEVQDLFVAGESASTGLHGANRLASNSLLEGLVFGFRAAHVARDGIREESLPRWVRPFESGAKSVSKEKIDARRREFSEMMSRNVSIVRQRSHLQSTLKKGEAFLREVNVLRETSAPKRELLELCNLTLVGTLITRSALLRRENRGLHYCSDFEGVQLGFARDTVLHSEFGDWENRELRAA